MTDQYSPPPDSGWGSPPPPPESGWGSPPPPPQSPGSGAPPSGGGGWQTPNPAAAGGGWAAPPPSPEPSWAPPPPPQPRQSEQSVWGGPQQSPGTHPDWAAPQQPSWGQPYGYGTPPAYGAFVPAPAPPRRRRLWIVLGAVAAAVVVVLVVGIIGISRLITRVPPATGATVSTSFVQLKVTSGWSETQTRSSELELNNKGDGDMLVGYGNSSQDGISSAQSAFSNLQANLIANTGSAVRQCVSQQGVTVGGKSGEEEGLRYTFQGTDLCEIAWVDYVSSSRYYYWNIADDYSHLSTLQNQNAAMQETANWKV